MRPFSTNFESPIYVNLHHIISTHINIHQFTSIFITWLFSFFRSKKTWDKNEAFFGQTWCYLFSALKDSFTSIYINLQYNYIHLHHKILSTFRSKETWDSNEAFFGQTWCHGQFWKPYLHQRKVHWFWWVEYDQWQVQGYQHQLHCPCGVCKPRF